MSKQRSKQSKIHQEENTDSLKDSNLMKPETSSWDESSYEDVQQAIDKGQLNIYRFGIQLLITSLALFVIGYAFTTITAAQVNYHTLALEQKSVNRGGEIQQVPRYPKLRRYVINRGDEGEPETRFSRAGTLGTGLYFYALINAVHWLMEMGMENVRGMALIPFFLFLGGSAFVFYVLWPKELRTPNHAFILAVILGAMHGIIFFIILFFVHTFSSTFSNLLGPPYHFEGQLSGMMIPGFMITFFTDAVYAGFAGVLIGVFDKMKSIFSSA